MADAMKTGFDPAVAQPRVWQRLLRTRELDKIGSAYLFSGPAGCGKEAMAIAFARLGNCESTESEPCGTCPSCQRIDSLQHENLTLVFPLPKEGTSSSGDDPLQGLSGKTLDAITAAIAEKAANPFAKIAIPRANTIPINAIRDLRKTAYLKTALQGRRFILIFDAHLLSTGEGATANALLKILEEPPENTTFILVTDHKKTLLPTIQSRCQQVDFPPLSDEFLIDWLMREGRPEEQVKLAAGLAQGDLRLARNLAVRKPKELLKQISRLSTLVLKKDSAGWREFVNVQSKLATSEPEEYRLNFYLLQNWFRAAYRQRCGISDILHENGMLGTMEHLNQNYPGTDYLGINAAIIAAIDALARNYYIPLTLTNFLTTVQRRMRGR